MLGFIDDMEQRINFNANTRPSPKIDFKCHRINVASLIKYRPSSNFFRTIVLKKFSTANRLETKDIRRVGKKLILN